jgi:uncharacterized protein with FMN-binding domain
MWIVATVVVLVLLFSYRTSLSGAGSRPGAASTAPGIVSGPTDAGGVPTGRAAPAGQSVPTTPTPATPTSPALTAPSPSSRETVVNGTVAQTVWGPVQVQVTVSGARITDVIALQVPSGTSMDQEINSFAVPQLRQEVLQAQSARIDAVTGATITSDGYVQSLQAALDTVHFQR